MAPPNKSDDASYLSGILVALALVGCLFWYSDYQRFHDSKNFVFETARASVRQVSKTEVTNTSVNKLEDDQQIGATSEGQPQATKVSGTVRDAQQLIEHGEPGAAVAILEEILKENPNDTQALMELAMIQILDLKNTERARQLLEQLIRTEPTHRAALNELINIYADPLRVDQGLQFLKSQFEFAVDPSELHYAYGRLLSQSGRADEALSHFDQAKGLKDIQDQVYVDAAQAAIQTGNYEKAFESYRNAVRLQEEELARARDQGIDSAAFIEDRILATKVDWARMLLRTGRVAQARGMIDSIYGHEDDPTIVALRNEMMSTSLPM